MSKKQNGIFIPMPELNIKEFDPVVYMDCYDEKIFVPNVICDNSERAVVGTAIVEISIVDEE